jgi:hypothetical protein
MEEGRKVKVSRDNKAVKWRWVCQRCHREVIAEYFGLLEGVRVNKRSVSWVVASHMKRENLCPDCVWG